MHRYEELEKLYYKKKYIKYGTIGSLIFIILIVSYYFFNRDIENKKVVKIKQTENNYTKKVEKKKIIKKVTKKDFEKVKVDKESNLKKEEIKEVAVIQKLVLYPIFPDINELLAKEKAKKEGDEKKVVEKENKIKKEQIKEKTLNNNETIKITDNTNKDKKESKKIEIVVKEKKDSLNNLIHFYNITPDYETAIKISKIYLKENNYKEAIEWLKKANKLIPENYESWYLFAKSLVKLGKTKEAKRVLVAYLNNYGANPKIEQLLRSLK